VRLVNLQDVLDQLTSLRRSPAFGSKTSTTSPENADARSEYMLPLMRAVVNMYHGPAVKLLRQHWATRSPTWLFAGANFNRPLFESLRAAQPQRRTSP